MRCEFKIKNNGANMTVARRKWGYQYLHTAIRKKSMYGIVRGLNKMSKFRSVITEVDGLKFHSKLEASYYQKLKILKKINLVDFWLQQVPFILPGGIKYLCDFLVFYTDRTHKFVDVKGFQTVLFKMKKKQVESIYNVKIEIVKKGDF